MENELAKRIIKYKNGDFYSGHFLKGFRSGFGTMSWSNGDVYTGNWEKDLQSGQGKLVKKIKML